MPYPIIPQADRLKFIWTDAQTSEAIAESYEDERRILDSLVDAPRDEGLVRESIPVS